MILQQPDNLTPLNRILCRIATFFGIGIALLLLNVFYEALAHYQGLMMRIFAFSAIVLVLSFVAYISVNIYLSIEYRATENEIFKQSRQQLQIASKADGEGEPESDTESRILELYNEMTASNSLSLNQIALEVYGKKGGYYNNRIREVLSSYSIDI